LVYALIAAIPILLVLVLMVVRVSSFVNTAHVLTNTYMDSLI